jgi:hypothetical protein
MRVCIFCGPTISSVEGRKYLDAEFLPPAAYLDVLSVAQEGPTVIGIVDGYFHRIPSVWHKEILWAMANGIHVFGASSIGALRAAELSAFGMIGVGSIFEAFRSGQIINDDEVAVLHGPAEVNYVALSEPLCNVRASLRAAVDARVIESKSSKTLLTRCKQTFFPHRSFAALLETGRKNGVPDEQIDRLEKWIVTNRVDQKKLDAVEMLQSIKDFVATKPKRKKVSYHLENTSIFDRLHLSRGLDPSTRPSGLPDVK